MHCDIKLADLKVALGHNTLMEVSDPLILGALDGCKSEIQNRLRKFNEKAKNFMGNLI